MVKYFKCAFWTIAVGMLMVSCGNEEPKKKMFNRELLEDDVSEVQEPTVVVEVDENRVEVEKLLKKQAQKDWPNDFVTQEYWVSQQLEDYQFMRSIPDDAIKAEVERDFPLDYTTQKYWYSEQVRARNRMSN